MRNCHAVLLPNSTIVHSNQQYMRVPISLHPCQCLILFVLLVLFVLLIIEHCTSRDEVVSYLNFLITNEWYWWSFHMIIGHLYISLVKCLFKSIIHFNWYLLSIIELCFFIYFAYWILIRFVIWKHFPSSEELSLLLWWYPLKHISFKNLMLLISFWFSCVRYHI